MVSDYKFHLFCKRLKKEKWRLGKDLSPAMMLLIFHCCLWVSRLGEPSVGCTELPGRGLPPGSPPCRETPRRPYGHRYRCSCEETPGEANLEKFSTGKRANGQPGSAPL